MGNLPQAYRDRLEWMRKDRSPDSEVGRGRFKSGDGNEGNKDVEILYQITTCIE
jgi:hypothetical protein